jgi:cytochrome oxidase Cu insertion factor (SCO1/SenC/PrrC family)
MTTGLNLDDPAVVGAFRAALLHQGLVMLLVFAVVGAVWAGLRVRRRTRTGGGVADPSAPAAEPAGRQVLLIGFGNLWLFDGILQAQPKMPLGLPILAIEPTAASSPTWVQHLVNWAGTSWSYHPVPAAAAVVWIQIGLGVWLLAGPRGTLSRLAGLASVGWGLVVWVFGESFGGILAPGLSWLSGAPGAAAIYVVAGVLIALPERAWHTPRLGRLAVAGLGIFLVLMAVLQAWPGRGFWQGTSHGQLGSLSGMTLSMADTPQPGVLAGWVASFAAFDEAHGFAINLIAVVVLAGAGAAFLSRRPRLIRPVLAGFAVLCLIDWVLIEDLGFLGGVGTDPNNMIPFIVLATGCYLALSRTTAQAAQAAAAAAEAAAEAAEAAAASGAAEPTSPAQLPSPAQVPGPAGTPRTAGTGSPAARWRSRVRPAALYRRALTASTRSAVALAGAALIALGTVPMAVAQASPDADPILAQSIAGSSTPANYRAPGFALTDQHGRTVTLASLRGRVVLLSFIDPACTTSCSPIGQEFGQAAQLLDGSTRQVELVGVVLGRVSRPLSLVRAFDRREGLNRVPNWLYLTGTPARLRQVWREYGIAAPSPAAEAAEPTGTAYVIDGLGRVRQRYRTAAGPGTAATRSSFAVLFADAARQAISPR